MRKLFVISSALLTVALVFFLAYNIAFKKNTGPGKDTLNNKVASENVSSADVKIKPLTKEPATGIFLDKKNEKIFFYLVSDGKVWQMDLDGERMKNISNESWVGMENVLWSPNGEKAIAVFGQGAWKKKFFLHEDGGKKSTELIAGIDTVTWDNLGTKIIYKYFEESTKNQSVNVANPDGSDWKKIADTKFGDLVISPIPKTSLVSFWNEGKSQEETELFVVGMNGGETKKIFSGKFGADYKWSPNGEFAVVSHLKDKDKEGMTTGLINIDGKYTELGVPTLVSKMEWSLDNKYIYYALPSMPEGVVMPDDYKDAKFKSADTFWKINTENGEKTRLIGLDDINGAYDVSRLMLSPSEDALFFVNKADSKIYKLDF